MVKKNPDYYVLGRKKASSYVYWFFFGLIIFITIYFPFFGSDLRYQTGATFSGVFNILGSLCNWIGWILVLWGICLTVNGRLGGLVVVLSGGLLVMFGGWLLDPYAFFIGGTPGYH